MEYLIGELRGELTAIKEAQNALTNSMIRHMEAEEKAFKEMRDSLIKMNEKQIESSEKQKSNWRVLTVLMTASSAAGAGMHKMIEKLFT